MSETSASAACAIDTSLCPLCGQSNQCANEAQRATGVAQGPCWCTTAVFPLELLARVPVKARRIACICARCASAAKAAANNPSHPLVKSRNIHAHIPR